MEEVHLVSAHTGLGIRRLLQTVQERKGPYFILGRANVGKSSLLNRLINASAKTESPLGTTTRSPFKATVSRVAGTTLGTIAFKLGDQLIYDTPGLRTSDATAGLTEADRDLLLPTTTLKPRSFTGPPGLSLLIGAVGRIDYEEGEKPATFTVWAAGTVPVHRSHISLADGVLQSHRGGILRPPLKPIDLPLVSLEPVEHFPASTNQACIDIVWPGIGWVAINGKGRVRVRPWSLPGATVREREPLLPFGTRLSPRHPHLPELELGEPPSLPLPNPPRSRE